MADFQSTLLSSYTGLIELFQFLTEQNIFQRKHIRNCLPVFLLALSDHSQAKKLCPKVEQFGALQITQMAPSQTCKIKWRRPSLFSLQEMQQPTTTIRINRCKAIFPPVNCWTYRRLASCPAAERHQLSTRILKITAASAKLSGLRNASSRSSRFRGVSVCHR